MLAYEASKRKQQQVVQQLSHEASKKHASLKPAIKLEETVSLANGKSPQVDVHLRPAIEADIQGLAKVYNCHIKNGISDQALEKATADDMLALFNACREEQLPLMVAILGKPRSTSPAYNGKSRGTGAASNTATKSKDQVVGFVYARNISNRGPGSLPRPTASKSQNRANLSVYVHTDYLQKGIGSCLMDCFHRSTSTTYVPYEEGTYQYVTPPDVDNIYLSAWECTVPEFRYFLIDIQCQGSSRSAPSEDDEQLIWKRNWLKKWNYEQVARVPFTGRTDWKDAATSLDTVNMLRTN